VVEVNVHTYAVIKKISPQDSRQGSREKFDFRGGGREAGEKAIRSRNSETERGYKGEGTRHRA